MTRSFWAATALVALVACDDTTAQTDPTPADAGVSADAEPMADAAPMADAEPMPDPDAGPPVEPTGWCDPAPTVADDDRPDPVQWSAAHAAARFFGPHRGTGPIDDALALALDTDVPATTYANTVPFVCEAQVAAAEALAPVAVSVDEMGVATVRPGTGRLRLPNGTDAVVLDLRHLGDGPELAAVLADTAAEVLFTDLPRVLEVWAHRGMTDGLFSPQSPFTMRLEAHDRPWAGQADRVRPLVVWTAPAAPPEVVAFAGALRMSGRAWLVGPPLFAATAESHAYPVGDAGLLVRVGTALDASGQPWPDEIPADAADLAALDAGWAEQMPPPVSGPAERARAEMFEVFRHTGQARPSAGTRPAMLITAHGMLRRFFPYFETVGDHIDDRLVETIDTLAEAEARGAVRADTLAAIRRFSEAISDGHAFIFDAVDPAEGVAPLTLDHLADETPVIRGSNSDAVQPGDTIVAIEGQPVAEWYADMLTRTSAASRGYALDLASRRYLEGDGPLGLTVASPDGETRSVSVARGPYANVPASTPWLHPYGWLDAWGAPGTLYVNMGDSVTTDTQALIQALDQDLPNAEALVLDMRGYPGVDHYQVAARVLGGDAFRGPFFDVPVWLGADTLITDTQQYTGASFGLADLPPFAGPVALLVGPRSVSAAENFSMMLVESPQVTVVGRGSAATNGNITGLWLPGAMGLTFTGMGVRFPSGGLFHGVGIQPDLEVWPTAASYAAADDLALQAAIDHVTAD